MAGSEDELLGAGGPESDCESMQTGVDPFAAAVAMDGARHDAALSRKAGVYLEEQQALVRLQVKHFHEEHVLAVEAARRKRYADRIRNGLLTAVSLIAIAIAGLFGVMVRNAMNDHGLVIEPFSVPPDIAATGLTGDVVASRFLDRLNAMQAATESERPADTYQDNWGSQIKVEIPETGISLGELQDLLREKLGHITHISGEVLRTPEGISITARWDNAPPQTFSGKLSDFDALAQTSAEAIYSVTQPFRYAQFLHEHRRTADAANAFTDLAHRGPAVETGWALSQLGYIQLNEYGDIQSARTYLERGAALGNMIARVGLLNTELWSGHDEKVLEYSKAIDRQAQIRLPDTTTAFFESNKLVASGYLAGQTGDFIRSAGDLAHIGRLTVSSVDALSAAAAAASDLALDHDTVSAKAALIQHLAANDIPFLPTDADQGWLSLPVYWIAAEKSDWPAALSDMQACDAWLKTQTPKHAVYGLMRPVLIVPLEALALAKTGDLPHAESLIAPTPADCYLCARVRAQIAAIKGDRAGSNRWFAEAVKLGPSIPFAYVEWGKVLSQEGEYESAISEFTLAHSKGPHFADPLEMWGEALMQENRSDLALAKFEEANRYAQNWGRLHLEWGKALFYVGKRDEAQKQFATAANLDLSAFDKSALAKWEREHG